MEEETLHGEVCFAKDAAFREAPAAPAPSADDRPSVASTVRVIAVPVALAAVAAACFVRGWVVAGVVATVLCVASVALEYAIGWVFVKYALRAHANMFKTLGPLLSSGEAPARRVPFPKLSPEEERRERAIDDAVGFGLTRAAAAGAHGGASITPEEQETLCANILEERALTYAWLQEAPSWAEVDRTASDGVELVAQRLVVDLASTRWALLCHGYGGTWTSMLQYARRFAEAGYNLLVPHMRGHGKSGGAYIGMGWLDRTDVVGWARWLVEGGSGGAGCTDIVLLGHSMGASSAGMAAGEPDLPAAVRAVVCDCGFDSAWHALSSQLQGAGAPVHPTLDLVRLNLMARRGGYDLAKGDVLGALAHTDRPVLVVHGLGDSTVPPFMAGLLYEAAAGEKRLLMVPGAGHCQSSLAAPDLYWDEVLSFAARHIGA